MSVITANDLKKRGVSIFEDSINNNEETIITVRGKNKFIVLDFDTYNYLRECELDKAISESKKDIEDGKVYNESIEDHIKRIKNV